MTNNLQIPNPQMNPDRVKVDCKGNKYITYPNGQVHRLSSEGVPLPRVRMSKRTYESPK